MGSLAVADGYIWPWAWYEEDKGFRVFRQHDEAFVGHVIDEEAAVAVCQLPRILMLIDDAYDNGISEEWKAEVEGVLSLIETGVSTETKYVYKDLEP